MRDFETIDMGGRPVRIYRLMLESPYMRSRAEEFSALLTRHRAEFMADRFRGCGVHRIRCVRGHETNVSVGQSLHARRVRCLTCEPPASRGLVWTSYYVVHDPAGRRVKVGVTGADPERRLNMHRRDGFPVVVRLLTGLPAAQVPLMEKAILQQIRASGHAPIRGREYFHDDALLLAVRAVDDYPLRQT